MLDLDALKIFCDLVETGSFTSAAERNYLSQSAVSQRIGALERASGQRLLERGRGKGRVESTEAGSLLYAGARPLLSEAALLEERISGLTDKIAGAVRVATVYSVGLHALPGRLKPFISANPSVKVHLEYSPTERVYQDVLTSAVDVGIVACPAERPGIEVIHFGIEEMVLVTPATGESSLTDEASLEGIGQQPFIAFSPGIPTRQLIDRRFAAAGVAPNIAMTFENIETIKNVVEIGSGITILPESSIRREVADGVLVARRFVVDERFNRSVGLVLKKNRTRRAAVRAFVEAMAFQEAS